MRNAIDLQQENSQLKAEIAVNAKQLASQSDSTQGASVVNETHHVMIVLDSSGSKASKIDGRRKTDIARDVVKSLLSSQDSNVRIGLIAYVHRRPKDCSDIEFEHLDFLPTAVHNESGVSSKIASLLYVAIMLLDTPDFQRPFPCHLQIHQ